jgi:hypothetical protein
VRITPEHPEHGHQLPAVVRASRSCRKNAIAKALPFHDQFEEARGSRHAANITKRNPSLTLKWSLVAEFTV